MKTTDSNDDGQRQMREALQRDAGRVKDEPFDAGLHYAAMRRIRALTGAGQPRIGWLRWATAAACAVALVLALLTAPWRPRPSSDSSVRNEIPAPVATQPSSAWAYRTAANESDETLLAMLDRDARLLLPPTASTFSTPLH
jgi:hypothetical protein